MIRVLFVCLGNICRSPMAEGIFQHLVNQAGLQEQIQVDSAGTADYHPNSLPDHRTRAVLNKYGMPTSHRARQLQEADFAEFDYILAMDHSNYHNIERVYHRTQNPVSRLQLMGEYEHDFGPQAPARAVPDPYYGEMEDFEAVYQMLLPACRKLLEAIQQAHF